jgi:hypothetical protein
MGSPIRAENNYKTTNVLLSLKSPRAAKFRDASSMNLRTVLSEGVKHGYGPDDFVRGAIEIREEERER